MNNNDSLSPAGVVPSPVSAGGSVGKGKRRNASKPVADDHVPAVLAASSAETAAVVTTAAEPVSIAPVAETAPADLPAPVTPPAAVPAVHADEDIMDTQTTAAAAEQTIDAAVTRGQAMFGDINTRATSAMEKGQKMFEEMNAFGKGNVEAMVESSKIAAKGVETLSQEAAGFTRRQFEGATQAMKTLAAVKSPTEFLKLQSDYARSMFDTMVAETSRSTEMMIKLANDVAQPISNRIAVAADKAKMAA